MLFTSFGFILLHVYSGPFDNRSYLCPFLKSASFSRLRPSEALEALIGSRP